MTFVLDPDLAAATAPAGSGVISATTIGAPITVRHPWPREVVLVAAFYGAYSFVRGQYGSSSAGAAAQAAANADVIIELERTLGIFNELALQQWFLQWPTIVRGFDIFYGLFHFVVPVAVLVVLHRQAPGAYRRARDTLAATTALALVGFSLFPLMPPRLLCACPLGSGTDSGFVDTLTRDGGLWSFGSHGVGAVSNQYAAMPSVHFTWALWCAVVVVPLIRRRWAMVAATAYPAITLVAIVVTANHFWLDAAGGALALLAGWALVVTLTAASGAGRRGLIQRHRTGSAHEDSVQGIAPTHAEAVP